MCYTEILYSGPSHLKGEFILNRGLGNNCLGLCIQYIPLLFYPEFISDL